MTSELHPTQSDDQDDHAAQRQYTRPSLGSRLRTVANWSLVFLVSVVAAF